MEQLEQVLELPWRLSHTYLADPNTRYRGYFDEIHVIGGTLFGRVWLTKEVKQTKKRPTYKLVWGFIPRRDGGFRETEYWKCLWVIDTETEIIENRYWWADELMLSATSNYQLALTTTLIDAVFRPIEEQLGELLKRITGH